MRLPLIINVIILLLILSTTAYANCSGCCSHHGGVVCSGGATQCADGSSLPITCKNKGCNKCGSTLSVTHIDNRKFSGIEKYIPDGITDFEKYLGLYIWKENGIIYIDEYPPASMRSMRNIIRKQKQRIVPVGGALIKYKKKSNMIPQRTWTGGLTISQKNAVRSAKNYLGFKGFSRNGLIKQLSSDHGDGYSVADAAVAIDSLNIDWNRQAVRSAKNYLSFKGFSCKGLIRQLSSSAGDGFTESQATYGARQAGVCQ